MSIPIGSMVLVYMLTLGVYWWDPCYHIYHTWILWDSLFFNLSNFYGKFPWGLGMFPSHEVPASKVLGLLQPVNVEIFTSMHCAFGIIVGKPRQVMGICYRSSLYLFDHLINGIFDMYIIYIYPILYYCIGYVTFNILAWYGGLA